MRQLRGRIIANDNNNKNADNGCLFKTGYHNNILAYHTENIWGQVQTNNIPDFSTHEVRLGGI